MGSPRRDAPGRLVNEPSRRVAIVTGASQGIGAGVVGALRQAGYAVVGTSRSIRTSSDPDLVTVRGDIAEPETADRVVQEALDRFGRIDSLINNAGVFLSKPFTEYTVDDYHRVTAVNLAGFFLITQRAIDAMVRQGRGHVVTMITSLVDHADSTSPSVLTALTKGGLAAATRALAIEYASRGIRVNAISAGVIQTPEHAAATYAGLAERQPIGRLGSVADIIGGVLYLEDADFVTGETLHVDGGWAAGH
jgi:NAD(P)-dependent dehydrogenase (short-subunit alcohol dehydrogenase family)